ncbi:MAG TPA: c-type cytochrome biogenesis protein CcmI [Geminicoccus sp.]|jgi:cytochrome c-type biogenesis protein CcmH|uniref:c-type cytochrome biogenesis protein CcmI n=1 Tax=Geminicoccus sp. TaxID=2024832 RepID=UPI002E36FB68|nr:c-type cytochrome biogenesis protein CcmI [Geminicoccus sp.]HEX2526399.1 c-type cytochrome biogenesis protein CcmI [Geminicoccus sp.]
MVDPVFVILAILLVGMAVAFLIWPIWSSADIADRNAYDLSVYKDQLAEVDRDLARGLILPDQAEAARIEIRRRMLRAGGKEKVAPSHRPRRSRRLLFVAALAVPSVALLVYLSLGEPGLPSLPFAARPAPVQAEGGQPDIARMVASLEERLAREPGDLDGWLLLGRSRAVLGQVDGSIEAYRRARELAPEDDRARVGMADALTTAAGGVVTPDARALFEQSLAAAGSEEAADPGVLFYLGLADAQAGDLAGAIQRWSRLLARAPADAPWRAQLMESIERASAQSGIEPPAQPDAAGPTASGPSAADVQAMAALSPEERNERIRSMVDGLDARLQDDPNDLEGWLRLGRARMVLGEKDRAAAAFEQASRLRPDDPQILADLGDALMTDLDEASGLPLVGPKARTVFERMAALAPDDPRPPWFLGLAAAQAGDRAKAASYWQSLLDRLPADHPDRAAIEELKQAVDVPR